MREQVISYLGWYVAALLALLAPLAYYIGAHTEKRRAGLARRAPVYSIKTKRRIR